MLNEGLDLRQVEKRKGRAEEVRDGKGQREERSVADLQETCTSLSGLCKHGEGATSEVFQVLVSFGVDEGKQVGFDLHDPKSE